MSFPWSKLIPHPHNKKTNTNTRRNKKNNMATVNEAEFLKNIEANISDEEGLYDILLGLQSALQRLDETASSIVQIYDDKLIKVLKRLRNRVSSPTKTSELAEDVLTSWGGPMVSRCLSDEDEDEE